METPSSQGKESQPKRFWDLTFQDTTVKKDLVQLTVEATTVERVVRWGSDVQGALIQLQIDAIQAGQGVLSRDHLLLQLLTDRQCQEDQVIKALLREDFPIDELRGGVTREPRPFPNNYQRPVRLPYDGHLTKVFEGLAGDPDTAKLTEPGDLVNAILAYDPEADRNL